MNGEFTPQEYLGDMTVEQMRITSDVAKHLIDTSGVAVARDFINHEMATNSKDVDTVSPEEFITDEESLVVPVSRTKQAAVVGALVMIAAVGALIFEQSPANESFRIPPAADIFRDTGSKEAVFAAVGALTLAIEIPASIAVSGGLHYKKERIVKIIDFFKGLRESKKNLEPHEAEPKDETLVSSKHNKGTSSKMKEKIVDTAFAFGLGPSILIAKKHIQNPDRTFGENVSTGVKASLAVSAIAGSIGYVSAMLITNAEKLGFMKKPAEYFVDYAADWKFWMVVVGSVQGAAYLRSKIGHAITERK